MWYYNLNNKPAGPIDDTAMQSLLQSGTISPATLVWQEGMSSWQPLGNTTLAGSLLGTGIIDAAGHPSAPQAERIKRDSLKKLYIWWLVTNCFFIFYMGFALLTNLGLVNYNSPLQAILTMVLCVTYMPFIASKVLHYILVYKFWKNIQDGFASTTPGKAVGYLFIPFYNFYWFFRAYWGLAKDSNRFIDRHFSDKPEIIVRKSKQWLPLTYLIFLFTGAVIYYAVFIVFFAANMNSANFGAISSPAGLSSMMLPLSIVALVYGFITWVLITLMMIDFYLTADSILKAKEQQ
jgi:hypothetical protein